jgi:glyoxylase-like metal-dependent hydrolase (beta-lactamase superfamily II)
VIEIERHGEVRVFRMARAVLGRGLYHTAAYWVDGLLVDTGCAHTVGELVSALAPYPIRLIVNTHGHEDHIGANSLLQPRSESGIRAHRLALPVLAEPPDRKHLRPYQRVMWGYPAPSAAAPIGEKVETSRQIFEVIHTPGHSRDHICLFEPDRGWLFCGDAYVGGQDRALRADYNIWQIMASLKKMAGLGVTSLFPGSGRAREEGQRLISEKIAYLEKTAERVLSLHRLGWEYDRIRREVFGAEMLICYLTLGHFSGRNLVRSLVEDRDEAG